MMTSGISSRVGKKIYYLDRELHTLLKNHQVTMEEIEREYRQMKLLTPRVDISYNHAAYQALLKRVGGKI